MSEPRYIVGIDLCTTNCVLSYIDTQEEHDLSKGIINIYQIPQLVAPGEVSEPERTFGLVVGQPVKFGFLASTIRPDDSVGDLINDWDETIEPITTPQTSMEASGIEPGTVIPLQLEATATEIGTLALSLFSKEKGLRFDLEFDVRG